MKILMINVVCGIRSTGRICTDLATALDNMGHEVKIAYGRENVPDKYKKYAVRIGSDIDVVLHGIKARLLDEVGFGSRAATLEFIEWVREYDPDVIHLHNLHGYYINIPVLFSYLKTCKKTIIWTLHDCWSFTGHCVYFDYVQCDKWKSQCEHCPQKNEYPARLLFDRSSKNFCYKKELFTGIENMTLVTPSRWLADLVSKSFLNEYPVVVISNGVDTSVFTPTSSEIKRKYHCEDKEMILGVAAVWDKRKGLDVFFELAQILDDKKYQIILVGLSEKQIQNLPANIIGITRTDDVKQLVELYSAADVYVNPTFEDNYPTTNLEAIACGTPVITFKTGGSAESACMYGAGLDEKKADSISEAITTHNYHFGEVSVDYQDSVRAYMNLIYGDINEREKTEF